MFFKDKIPTFLLDYNKYSGEVFEIRAKEFLDANNIDYLFLTCDRILHYALLESYCKDKKAFNLHPALLPKYVGMRAVERCYESSDVLYGATIHYVTKEVDLGPRIARLVIKRDFSDSLEIFTHRLFVNQCVFLLDFMAKVIRGFNFEILSEKISLKITPPFIINKEKLAFFNLYDKQYLQI